jgi:hypothetical protein
MIFCGTKIHYKIKAKKVTNSYNEGDLNMTDLESFYKTPQK